MVLGSEPLDTVTVDIATSLSTEGDVSTNQLTFTVGDWDTEQFVVVTGQPDDVDDGDQAYTVSIGPVASTGDTQYDASVTPSTTSFSMTNEDIDTAAIIATAAAGTTSESGGSTTFTVYLATKPSADVDVFISSDDTTEGTAAPAMITFDDMDWNVPQVITVSGEDDVITDGDITYTYAERGGGILVVGCCGWLLCS